MTSEYERQLERARLARRQGMGSQDADYSSTENRIEDVLRSKGAEYVERVPVAEYRERVEIKAPEQKVLTQTVEKTGKSTSYKRLLKRIIYMVTAIIFLPAVILGGYRVFLNFEAAKDTAPTVLEKVGKLVSLPQDEEPTVATITDLKPLEGQEFFKDARIGDKVIFYKEAGRAILYRPTQNKVITAAPLTK
jgi:mRNA-degrading endonuclease RelE of RelBE toxin-antitoxin system